MSTLQYVQPTEEQKVLMQIWRDKMDSILQEMQSLPKSRGIELALAKFEESAMWLNKALTNND